jgi:hypothetical protein
VVYAFRGTLESEQSRSFQLRGLELSVRYRLRFHDHTSTDRTITGEQLMRDGLQVTLKLPNSSELIFLEPTPE